jgi:hypothetical protein
VIHLDPRLADGSSSAQTLQSAQVSWIERVEVVDSSSELTPWSALYCQIDPVADGGPGIALRGNVPDETRFRRVELRSSAVYNADEVDFIELDLGRTTSGIVRVSWRSSLDIVPSAFPRATTALIAAPSDLRRPGAQAAMRGAARWNRSTTGLRPCCRACSRHSRSCWPAGWSHASCAR